MAHVAVQAPWLILQGAISLLLLRGLRNAIKISRKPKIPIVSIKGHIASSLPTTSYMGPLQVNSQSLDPVLVAAFSMPNVVCVALSINCPGGEAAESSIIFKRIRQLSQETKIPVYAFVSNMAASGGYMLACSADKIFVDENSVVGSIGVVSSTFNFSSAIRKLGVERRVIATGENKSFMDPFLPTKEQDILRLQDIQRHTHQYFKDLVKNRRAGQLKFPQSLVDETSSLSIADQMDQFLFNGSFWVGKEAEALGLVDGIGTIHSVLPRDFGSNVFAVPMKTHGGFTSLIPAPGTGIDGVSSRIINYIENNILSSRYKF
jgi:signal peptide peptidase SppA